MPARILSRLLDRREEFHWKKREFAAELELLPLTNGERDQLTDRVREFNERRFAVPGLIRAHFQRPVVAELRHDGFVETSYGPLFFYCEYTGDLDDVLSMLFESCPELMRGVLHHTRGYDVGQTDVDGGVRRLTAARTKASTSLRRSGYVAAPRSKREKAAALPLMTPFERSFPGEADWTARMSELLETRMRRANREARRRDPKAVALRGAHVTALDLSEEQLKFAAALAARYEVHIELVQHDMSDLAPIAADSMDIVFSAFALQFVADRTTTFREVRRVLRPGGTFVFSIDHPFFRKVDPETLRLVESYNETGPLLDDRGEHGEVMIYRDTIAGLHQAAVDAGLTVERMVEPNSRIRYPYDPWFGRREVYVPKILDMVPPTLIVKSLKPRH